jgi:hypothetical protein
MSKKLRAMLHLTLLFLSLVWSGQSDAAPEDRESLAIKTATASVTLLGDFPLAPFRAAGYNVE